jgi:hypothetical protein
MENFGKFMAFILSLIILPIINGFVFCKVWGWFIVDTFNVQPLRIIEGIGLLIVISFVFARIPEKEKDYWEAIGNKVLYTIVYALLILLIGYLYSLFI